MGASVHRSKSLSSLYNATVSFRVQTSQKSKHQDLDISLSRDCLSFSYFSLTVKLYEPQRKDYFLCTLLEILLVFIPYHIPTVDLQQDNTIESHILNPSHYARTLC